MLDMKLVVVMVVPKVEKKDLRGRTRAGMKVSMDIGMVDQMGDLDVLMVEKTVVQVW